MSAFIVGVFEGDVDAWRERFDADPLGRKEVATGHTILRGVDNPNQIFVRLDFQGLEAAKAFAQKVRNSDVLAGLTLVVAPTPAEMEDEATY